eukprot:scaffold1257_cov14-Tisochrysis_lutea.AAC.2
MEKNVSFFKYDAFASNTFSQKPYESEMELIWPMSWRCTPCPRCKTFMLNFLQKGSRIVYAGRDQHAFNGY